MTGRVQDEYGQGLSNRTVLIGSRSTTTDVNGQFTLTGIATPYDLVVVEPAPRKAATIYLQLTRTDPKLLNLATQGTPAQSATLGGNISGGVPLSTAGTLTAVTWASPGVSSTTYVNATPYSFIVPWAAPATITGTVHGLQFSFDQNFTVTGYPGYGVKTGVSLTSGGSVTDADIQLAPVTTGNISTNISTPAGHEIVERDVFLTFDDGAFFQVSQDALDAGTFQVPIPSNIGAKANVLVGAATSDGSSASYAQVSALSPGTLGAALNLPSPARVTAPDTGATGVDTNTDLVWTPVSGAIHALFISATAPTSADPGYAIVTGGTHARIPDLSAQGLGLPSGRLYDVVLVATGPYASVDAYTETTVYPLSALGFQTLSFTRFTTR